MYRGLHGLRPSLHRLWPTLAICCSASVSIDRIGLKSAPLCYRIPRALVEICRLWSTSVQLSPEGSQMPPLSVDICCARAHSGQIWSRLGRKGSSPQPTPRRSRPKFLDVTSTGFAPRLAEDGPISTEFAPHLVNFGTTSIGFDRRLRGFGQSRPGFDQARAFWPGVDPI